MNRNGLKRPVLEFCIFIHSLMHICSLVNVYLFTLLVLNFARVAMELYTDFLAANTRCILRFSYVVISQALSLYDL